MARRDSPKWDRKTTVRLPDALHRLIENEAVNMRDGSKSFVIVKALRHYFNCPHAQRSTQTGRRSPQTGKRINAGRGEGDSDNGAPAPSQRVRPTQAA